MTLTITFGWWLIPAIITLAAFGYALNADVKSQLRREGSFSGRLGAYAGITWWAIYGTIYMLASLISAVAWIVWLIWKLWQ